MRICLYTETAIPMLGGQALVVDALARQLSALGHTVVVLAPRQRHAGALDEGSLPYRMVRHPRLYSTRWFVRWYARWLHLLHRQHHFDVVHCHSTYPNGYVAASCRALAEVPLVITSHGSDLDPLSLLMRKPQLRARYLLALERSDAVVAVSDCTAERFRQVCPGVRRIERIPNGVDLARFAAAVPRPAEFDPAVRPGEYLLLMGRLEPRKGVDLLLDAFALVAEGNDVDLVIAGEGSALGALREQAAGLGLGNRVRFVGRVEDDTKTWLLAHARCSVIPSRISEAFPLALLESCASGRPVIGTRIPGLAELIAPQQTGLLVPPDSAEELAHALGTAIREPQQMDALGRQARRIAQAFDWSHIARRHVELFADLISQRHARQAA